jgi:hypothetical protein
MSKKYRTFKINHNYESKEQKRSMVKQLRQDNLEMQAAR